ECSGIDEQKSQFYCNQIVPDDSTDLDSSEQKETEHSSSKKRYLKVFAILILQEKGSYISKFIDFKVGDDDLPLVKFKDKKGRERGLALSRDDTKPLMCFNGWHPCDCDNFFRNQWLVTVPFFGLGRDNTIKHHELAADTVLPWVEFGESKTD